MKPNKITIHCTATKASMDIGAKEIKKWHVKGNGWSDIGYHYIIRRDGTIEEGRPLNRQGAHVKGYNKNNIGISYVGGLDDNMKPEDNRTQDQKDSLDELINNLCQEFNIEDIRGHRDYPGVSKACPCFNSIEEYTKYVEYWKR